MPYGPVALVKLPPLVGHYDRLVELFGILEAFYAPDYHFFGLKLFALSSPVNQSSDLFSRIDA